MISFPKHYQFSFNFLPFKGSNKLSARGGVPYKTIKVLIESRKSKPNEWAVTGQVRLFTSFTWRRKLRSMIFGPRKFDLRALPGLIMYYRIRNLCYMRDLIRIFLYFTVKTGYADYFTLEFQRHLKNKSSSSPSDLILFLFLLAWFKNQ